MFKKYRNHKLNELKKVVKCGCDIQFCRYNWQCHAKLPTQFFQCWPKILLWSVMHFILSGIIDAPHSLYLFNSIHPVMYFRWKIDITNHVNVWDCMCTAGSFYLISGWLINLKIMCHNLTNLWSVISFFLLHEFIS